MQDLAVNTEILPEVCQNFEQLGTYRGIPVTVGNRRQPGKFHWLCGTERKNHIVKYGNRRTDFRAVAKIF